MRVMLLGTDKNVNKVKEDAQVIAAPRGEDEEYLTGNHTRHHHFVIGSNSYLPKLGKYGTKFDMDNFRVYHRVLCNDELMAMLNEY